jgi:hypothetical protein
MATRQGVFCWFELQRVGTGESPTQEPDGANPCFFKVHDHLSMINHAATVKQKPPAPGSPKGHAHAPLESAIPKSTSKINIP